jgi:phenolic acid decarboxylase
MFSAEYRQFICNTSAKYMCHGKKVARRFVKVSSVRNAHVRETIYRMVERS